VRYVIELLFLSAPILLGQLGQMLITTGDIYVAGKFSTDAVAALGIANGVIVPIFLMGMGMLNGISPRLAQKRGAGEDINRYLSSVILYSIIVALLWIAVLHGLLPLLPHLGFDQRLLPLVRDYISLFSYSLFGAYIFQAIREFMQAKENVLLPNSLMVISVVVNVILNYIFVFGYGPISPLGFSGLALASIGVRGFLAISIFILVLKHFRFRIVELSFFTSLLKLSIPIALNIFLEVSSFSFASLIIATISAEQVAAHTIILNLSAIAFMFPLSISISLAIKSGHAFGQQDYLLMKKWLFSGIFISILFTAIVATIYSIMPAYWIGLFTADSTLISIAVPLLYVVAIFQLVDGVQAALVGFLRGMNMTKIPLVVSFIGYWIIGLGGGSYLCIHLHYKALGMWMALACALALASILLSSVTYRYYWRKFLR
jgi:MATE family multidrug resistance protein